MGGLELDRGERSSDVRNRFLSQQSVDMPHVHHPLSLENAFLGGFCFGTVGSGDTVRSGSHAFHDLLQLLIRVRFVPCPFDVENSVSPIFT